MVEVLVLDLDDTLYLERDYVHSGLQAVAAHVATRHGIAGFLEIAWRHFEAGLRGTIFDATLRDLDNQPDPALIPALIEELVAVYRGHEPRVRLAPDAARVLAQRHRFRAIALLTDGPLEAQQRKVRALGLETCCAPIVYTDRWGRAGWKPSPRGFLALQAHFGLPGHAFAYIGDNPAKDFTAPTSLGWRTVRVRRPLGEHAAVADAPGAAAAEHASEDLLAALGWLDGSGHRPRSG